jgi:hypothetical protein
MLKHLLALVPILMSEFDETTGGGSADPLSNDDPLNMDFETNDVDTSYPLLQQGKYRMRIKEYTVKPNQAGDGRNLVIKFETIDPATSVAAAAKGEENDLKPGFVVTRHYSLQPSKKPGSTWDWKKDPIALCDAALGTKQGSRQPFGEMVKQLPGKEVKVTLKVRQPKEGDDLQAPQNDIAKVEAPHEETSV